MSRKIFKFCYADRVFFIVNGTKDFESDSSFQHYQNMILISKTPELIK